MSEFGFIEGIKKLFSSLPERGFEGIGDDCAVLDIGGGESLVFTVDTLAEDVHFLRASSSAYEIGAKSLAVNLSDVAAMGAEPVASLLSLSLPADACGEWAGEFMRGYHALSEQWGVALAGGDTTSSKTGITISITAIGRVRNEHIKRRSAAVAGDVVMVCGELGASAAGLRDILDGDTDTPFAIVHRNPVPQIEEGRWLGAHKEVHAMMDLSDGLASDLRHILKASHTGAEIETANIPYATDTATAVCGGEDYKLLFTVAAASAESLQREFALRFGYAPSVVGRIRPVSEYGEEICWLENGVRIFPDWQGFSHF